MIEVKEVDGSVMIVELAGRLDDTDFGPLAAQVDNQIELFGAVRLLLDARNLEGWDNVAASQTSVEFIRQRGAEIDRLAVIVDEAWQQWAAGLAGLLMDGALKTFDIGHAEAAKAWIVGRRDVSNSPHRGEGESERD